MVGAGHLLVLSHRPEEGVQFPSRRGSLHVGVATLIGWLRCPRKEEKAISDPPGVSFLSLLGLQVSARLGSGQLGPGPRWPLGGAARKA